MASSLSRYGSSGHDWLHLRNGAPGLSHAIRAEPATHRQRPADRNAQSVQAIRLTLPKSQWFGTCPSVFCVHDDSFVTAPCWALSSMSGTSVGSSVGMSVENDINARGRYGARSPSRQMISLRSRNRTGTLGVFPLGGNDGLPRDACAAER